MTDIHPAAQERWILTTELLWAFGVGIFIAAALTTIVFTALKMGINPPSNVERIDPSAISFYLAPRINAANRVGGPGAGRMGGPASPDARGRPP